jgi:hypothetical protein
MTRLLPFITRIIKKPRQYSIQEAKQVLGMSSRDIPETVKEYLEKPDHYDVWFEGNTYFNRRRIQGKFCIKYRTAEKVDGLWRPDKVQEYPLNMPLDTAQRRYEEDRNAGLTKYLESFVVSDNQK